METPKKPNVENINFSGHFAPVCPSCGEVLDGTEEHCPECGQAIDWEVEDD